MERDLRVLFFVEGYTDIRFVVGLSSICRLVVAVPSRPYVESGLKQRLAQSSASLRVDEINGGRVGFQLRSFVYLWQRARDFDVILSQEALRGSLNANVIGALQRVPVVMSMGSSPVESFRCRRIRRQINWSKAVLGETVIWTLLRINGRLAARCLGIGPYLHDVAARFCPRTQIGLHHGVDTDYFRPADHAERAELRRKLDLPVEKFMIFCSSRISHEKDPETVLKAAALARTRGLDAVLINLGGGYKEFLHLAGQLHLPEAGSWVLGRPAAHPMTELADYFRAADVLAQASLAEGLGFSPLEALACGTPVVATAVGGMAVQLKGYARLTPLRDPEAMAEQFLWVRANPDQARAQALQGREFVIREWNRQKAFVDLLSVLETVVRKEQVADKRKRNGN